MDFGISFVEGPLMETDEDRWAAVGRAIAARIDEKKLTMAEVQRRAEISDKTLKGYLAGRPVRRVDKARRLCEALGWSHDSIRLLMDGQPAVEAAESSGPDDRLARLEDRVDELEAGITALRQRTSPEAAAVHYITDLATPEGAMQHVERIVAQFPNPDHQARAFAVMQDAAEQMDAGLVGPDEDITPRPERVQQLWWEISLQMEAAQPGTFAFTDRRILKAAAHGGDPESVEDVSDQLSKPVSGFDPDAEVG